ncbi:MAG: helix-turn-helix transcriptional regulator [Rhodanobacter sp.]
MNLPDYMTTGEAADYLRVQPRKIYDLIRRRAIPCSRVTGKWLFPRALVDLWVRQGNEYRGTLPAPNTPPVIAGSHDPLLEWATVASESGLALLQDGSLDGLKRLADGSARAAGIHLRDPVSGDYNSPWLRQSFSASPLVAVEWAQREQGLILPPGNPSGIRRLADISGDCRVVQRQAGAGSRLLFEQLLADAGIEAETVTAVNPPARSETDVALAVLDGKADVGFGIHAVARRFRLDFLTLYTERYDIALTRRDYFEPPFQALLAFSRSAEFADRARELGGYDLREHGRIRYNADV